MLYITRKEHFSASHRLFNPKWSEEKNASVFGKCNNLHGHGHNYEIEVTVAGAPPVETGMVMDLKKLADLIRDEIIEKVDHKHLNLDVEFFKDIIPTAENMAVVFWKILKPKITDGKLHSIKVYESDDNFVEYRGE
jgi:6-pyruvoyltetrahydropterin/6-carboxytetrahydropterin synthase